MSRAVLPEATIVVDKFHVVRMANYGVEKVRKALRERFSPKERRGLDEQRRFMLDNWTTLHPTLGLAYRLKESFYAIYNAPSRAEAERRYAAWLLEITPATAEAFQPLTTAWKNWHAEILAYFEHRVTNA